MPGPAPEYTGGYGPGRRRLQAPLSPAARLARRCPQTSARQPVGLASHWKTKECRLTPVRTGIEGEIGCRQAQRAEGDGTGSGATRITAIEDDRDVSRCACRPRGGRTRLVAPNRQRPASKGAEQGYGACDIRYRGRSGRTGPALHETCRLRARRTSVSTVACCAIFRRKRSCRIGSVDVNTLTRGTP